MELKQQQQLERAESNSLKQEQLSALERLFCMERTIRADVLGNQQIAHLQCKLTLGILLFMLCLKLLPSPIVSYLATEEFVYNSSDTCIDDLCVYETLGNQTVLLRKVNVLNREVRFYGYLNEEKLVAMGKSTKHISMMEQIVQIKIFGWRNGERVGNAISDILGWDLSELVVNGQARFEFGRIITIEQGSYQLYIQKIINHEHRLQRTQTNNSASASEQHQMDTSWSIPICVELSMYTGFYTVSELVFRYILLLIVLYVISETRSCPLALQIILVTMVNPLIFTQVAFPNIVSNTLSTMCNSSYIFYLGIYICYTHRRMHRLALEVVVFSFKMLLLLALYSIRMTSHSYNGRILILEIFSWVLAAAVMGPLVHHVWKMYFGDYRHLHHRDMVLTLLTGYYLAFLFFSNYLVDYGWVKLVRFLIMEVYAINLCFITKEETICWRKSRSDTANVETIELKREFFDQQSISQKTKLCGEEGQQSPSHTEVGSLPTESILQTMKPQGQQYQYSLRYTEISSLPTESIRQTMNVQGQSNQNSLHHTQVGSLPTQSIRETMKSQGGQDKPSLHNSEAGCKGPAAAEQQTALSGQQVA